MHHLTDKYGPGPVVGQGSSVPAAAGTQSVPTQAPTGQEAPTEASTHQKARPLWEEDSFTEEWWSREKRLLEKGWREELAQTRESSEARLKALEGEAGRSISKMQKRVTEVGEKYNLHDRRIQEVLSWKGTLKRTIDSLERDVHEIDQNLDCLFDKVKEMAETLELEPEQHQYSGAVQELSDEEGERRSTASLETGNKSPEPSLNEIDEGVYPSKSPIRKRGREQDVESSSEEGEVKAPQPKPEPAAGGKPKATKAPAKSRSPMNLRKKPSGKGTQKKK